MHQQKKLDTHTHTLHSMSYWTNVAAAHYQTEGRNRNKNRREVSISALRGQKREMNANNDDYE